MKVFALSLLALLLAQDVFAARYVKPLRVDSFYLQETGRPQPHRYAVSFLGSYDGDRRVSCHVDSYIVFKGKIDGLDCDALEYKCSLVDFRILSGKFVADLYADISGKGVEKISTLSLGTLAEDKIVFSERVVFKAKLIQDIFTMWELVTERKIDKSICSIDATTR